jgi:hypothetical protein
VWTGRSPSRLRRLAPGGSPSWSPDSRRLIFTHRGVMYVAGVGKRKLRRLGAGADPAWSPDGTAVAYLGPGHRVYLRRLGSGRVTRLASVRARAVDWQPLPPQHSRLRTVPCAQANGRVVAENRPITIRYESGRAGIAWNGCLHALDRSFHLTGGSNTYGPSAVLAHVALAAPYAVLQFYNYDKTAPVTDTVQVYDLRTGMLIRDQGTCAEVTCQDDQLVANANGFAAWHQTYSVPSYESFRDVSCPDVSMCVGVGDGGSIAVSTSPTGGREAWNVVDVDAGIPLYAISCPSVSLCVTVDRAGNVITSTDPTAGAPAWTVTHVEGGTPSTLGHSFNDVSCPSVSFCVAVDTAGNVATSSNPTGGGSAWQLRSVVSTSYGLTQVACPTVSLCLASDNDGNVVSSTDPAGDGAAWIPTALGAVVTGIACPSRSFCVATNGSGQVLSSTDPTGGSGAWSATTLEAGALVDVACASPSSCTAIDQAGNVLTSDDPGAGAAAWSTAPIDSSDVLVGLSCASTSSCVAVDSTGHVLASANPSGGSAAWSNTLVYAPPCAPSTPCLAERVEVLDDAGSRAVDTAPPGTGTAIADLALDGDTLSWTHGGGARETQLG